MAHNIVAASSMVSRISGLRKRNRSMPAKHYVVLFDEDGYVATVSEKSFPEESPFPAVGERCMATWQKNRYLVEALFSTGDKAEAAHFEGSEWPNCSQRAKAIISERILREDGLNGGYLDVKPGDVENDTEREADALDLETSEPTHFVVLFDEDGCVATVPRTSFRFSPSPPNATRCQAVWENKTYMVEVLFASGNPREASKFKGTIWPKTNRARAICKEQLRHAGRNLGGFLTVAISDDELEETPDVPAIKKPRTDKNKSGNMEMTEELVSTNSNGQAQDINISVLFEGCSEPQPTLCTPARPPQFLDHLDNSQRDTVKQIVSFSATGKMCQSTQTEPVLMFDNMADMVRSFRSLNPASVEPTETQQSAQSTTSGHNHLLNTSTAPDSNYSSTATVSPSPPQLEYNTVTSVTQPAASSQYTEDRNALSDMSPSPSQPPSHSGNLHLADKSDGHTQPDIHTKLNLITNQTQEIIKILKSFKSDSTFSDFLSNWDNFDTDTSAAMTSTTISSEDYTHTSSPIPSCSTNLIQESPQTTTHVMSTPINPTTDISAMHISPDHTSSDLTSSLSASLSEHSPHTITSIPSLTTTDSSTIQRPPCLSNTASLVKVISDPDDIIPGNNIEFKVHPFVVADAIRTSGSLESASWKLCQKIYNKEELMGRNFRGNRGKDAISPGRSRALMNVLSDYTSSETEFKSKSHSSVDYINQGLRNIYHRDKKNKSNDESGLS